MPDIIIYLYIKPFYCFHTYIRIYAYEHTVNIQNTGVKPTKTPQAIKKKERKKQYRKKRMGKRIGIEGERERVTENGHGS